MRVSSKKEITLTIREHKELLRLVHERVDLENPRWLLRKFKINQCRRKFLNDLLYEAGCSGEICSMVSAYEDWSAELHRVYHRINKSTPCK